MIRVEVPARVVLERCVLSGTVLMMLPKLVFVRLQDVHSVRRTAFDQPLLYPTFQFRVLYRLHFLLARCALAFVSFDHAQDLET